MDILTHGLSGIAFIDFEASSLSDQSWPIEVGLSWIEDDFEVSTWSSLIRPDPSWSDDGWSDVSAGIHGITKEMLSKAPPASTVAGWFFEILDGRTPLADAPPHDQFWLDRLLATVGEGASPKIKHFNIYSFGRFEGLNLDRIYEYLETHKAPHRAGPDSARIANSWMRIINANRSS
jgi:hypothetical protein